MRNETEYGECFCTVGSVTQTMRAQSALASAAVRAEVVSADPAHASRGCAYALSYPCAQERLVGMILQNAGIRVRSFYKGGRE